MSKFYPLKLRDVSKFYFAFLSLLCLVCISPAHLKAQQVPDAINYQAIVRDSETLLPVTDRGVYVSVEFLNGPDGDILYQEEFSSLQTSKSGLVNLSLGQGNPMINSFEQISWESGNIWLRLSIDIGNGLNILQETPFNTVPYAFYAESSGGEDSDSDSTNELIEDADLTGNALRIIEAGETHQVDLSSLIDDADADPTNEFQNLGNVIVTPNEEVEITLTDGSSTTINIQDADADATNEIQTVESTDGTVTVTPNGTNFDLSVNMVDGSITAIDDGQNTTVNGTGTSADPYSVDVPDNLDNDPVNEIQDISTDNSAGNISLSDGSTLTINVDDADSDATNEIQTIQSTDGSVAVTPNGNDFDLSVAAADGSETIINDGQNTTVNGSGTSSDPYSVDVPDNLDNDPTNEIQDISTDNSAGNISLSDGSTLTINVDDADTDATNEIQDLSLSNDILSLTGDGTTVDLSEYDNSQLSQNHIFLGDAAGDAQQVQVTGDVNIAANGNITVRGIRSVDVSTTTPTDGQVLTYDSGASQWRPATPPIVTPTEETHYYSIDPLDFRQLVDNNIGVQLSTGNTLVFFDDEAPFAMLRDENGLREIMAPIHLPHGAEMTNLKIYFHDSGPGIMWFGLYRKSLTDFSYSNEILIWEQPAVTGDQVVDENITSMNVIDNSTYVYRLYVRFTAFENDDNAGDPDLIEQRVYGAVIEYTTN